MALPWGVHVGDDVTVIEDLLREPLDLRWYRITETVPYRAIEVGDVRYGWTIRPRRGQTTGGMVPKHFALSLRLSPTGVWRVEEAKPFELSEDAERWARGLWRDATTRGAST